MNRKRYLLLGALSIMSLLLFQVYVLTPRSEELREEIQSKSATLQKYEAYKEGASITEAELKTTAEAVSAAEKRLVKEGSEFLAGAHVQKELTELTQKTGINVQTIRPLSVVKAKPFYTVPVYFEGSGTIKQVGDFLEELEKQSLMLRIEKLSVNVTNMQNPRELRIKMQIAGMGRL